MNLPEHVIAIKDYLAGKGLPEKIDAAVILGSGLGDFGRELNNRLEIPYNSIPGFPLSTVTGHSGALIFGEVEGKATLAFSGRFHFYEGHSFARTVLPVQLAKAFNAGKLIISNAAGGINLNFRVGDLMIIRDIIRLNMMLSLPYPEPWHLDLHPVTEQVQHIAARLGIKTHTGNYLYVKGPNYETKAEIHAFRKLGGDAVGMSTAPELIEAARIGLKTTAISLITNAAAGVTGQKLDHDEVKGAAESKKHEFAALVKGLIKEL